MYAMRLWATRRAAALEVIYQAVEPSIRALDPLWRRIGYGRLERGAAALESWVKGALFDCRMCGCCVLSSTGMTCPMNCPKSMRNGPCGGVRPDGACEVEPAIRCVWVEAWEGSMRMRGGKAMATVRGPVDHALDGTSSWLRLLRQGGGAAADGETGKGRK